MLKRSFMCCYITWMNVLVNLEVTTYSRLKFSLVRIFPYSVQIWENTDQKKLRIWTLFTQWYCHLNVAKLFFEEKFSDKSRSKTPIQPWAWRERNACSKEKKRVKIIFHNKSKLTQYRYAEAYRCKFLWLKMTKFCARDENYHRRKLIPTKF